MSQKPRTKKQLIRELLQAEKDISALLTATAAVSVKAFGGAVLNPFEMRQGDLVRYKGLAAITEAVIARVGIATTGNINPLLLTAHVSKIKEPSAWVPGQKISGYITKWELIKRRHRKPLIYYTVDHMSRNIEEIEKIAIDKGLKIWES